MMFKKPKKVGRMPNINIGRLPNAFKDTDKDLTPDMIDCAPRNPRKQGVVSWLKEKASTVDTKLKEYNTPEAREERYQRKLQNLSRKEELEKARGRLTSLRTQRQSERLGLQKQRLQLQTQRQTLTAQRQRSMPSMSGGFGSAPAPSLSVITPSPGLGTAPKVQKPRKRKKKSSKSKTIIIRTG